VRSISSAWATSLRHALDLAELDGEVELNLLADLMSSVYGLGRDGSPTLIDFGASRVAIAGRTRPLTAVFTPTFAAPEQFTSGQQGPYTDFYATAATLYACLNGKEPISAANRMMGGASMPSDREAASGEYCRPLDCAAQGPLRPYDQPGSTQRDGHRRC